jgi:hypothetical protein
MSFEQNINKIWIFKIHVFVMFKMKYLIYKFWCNILSHKWGGSMVEVFVSILKVNGSNLICGVVCG